MPAETILVVEDDPAIRKALQMNLQLEGYRVLCAEDGEQGRRHCLADSPDLLLVDLMLPLGLVEVARTGVVAISRGTSAM